jgi:hypothetical protein
MTYDVENPGPGFEQAQKCGRVKPNKYVLNITKNRRHKL